jgi:hypothetical protein
MSDQFLTWKSLNMLPQGILSSPSMSADWRPRVAMEAYCGKAHDLRELAYSDCVCGIYGVKDPKEALGYIQKDYQTATYKDNTCLAQIALWGWVHEGSTGYRAQYAYPKQLIAHPETDKKLITKIGETYQVPVMFLEQDEWNQLAKDLTSSYARNKYADIDLTKYTQAQIDKALRQSKRQKLYMKIRNAEKTLEQRIHFRDVDLPRIIKDLETSIAAMKAEREAL